MEPNRDLNSSTNPSPGPLDPEPVQEERRLWLIVPVVQKAIDKTVERHIRKHKKIQEILWPCGTKVSSKFQLVQHQKGKKCEAKLERKELGEIKLYCCGRTFNTRHDYNKHFGSKKCWFKK